MPLIVRTVLAPGPSNVDIRQQRCMRKLDDRSSHVVQLKFVLIFYLYNSTHSEDSVYLKTQPPVALSTTKLKVKYQRLVGEMVLSGNSKLVG